MATKITKKRKFVSDGIFYTELNEMLTAELGAEGYSGVEVRANPVRTDLVVKTTRGQMMDNFHRRIEELKGLISKRFNFKAGGLELFVKKVANPSLCAETQAESLRRRLDEGVQVRKACNDILRGIMRGGARGCEIVISGKVRAQRAKAMKFTQGYMVKSGDGANHYIVKGLRTLRLKLGMLGIKVKIMLPYDPTGEEGVSYMQPDVVTVKPRKDDVLGTVSIEARAVNF